MLRVYGLIWALCVSLVPPVFARPWTIVDGETFEAEYQEYDFPTRMVTLKLENGALSSIDLSSLEVDDVIYVYRQQGPKLTDPLPPADPAPVLTPQQAIDRLLELRVRLDYVQQDPQKPLETVTIQFTSEKWDECLATVRCLTPFKTLSLFSPNLTPAALAHLREMRHFQELKLTGLGVVNDSLLRYIAEMPELKVLGIHGVTSVSGRALAILSHSKSIESLTLSNVPLAPADIYPLNRMQQLHQLSLPGCALDNPCFEAVSELKQLTGFATACTTISDHAGVFLQTMPQLKMLQIDSSRRITDAFIPYVLTLPELQTLSLVDTTLTDEGLLLLKGKPKLALVYVRDTQVTEAAAMELQMSLQTRTRRVFAAPRLPGTIVRCPLNELP